MKEKHHHHLHQDSARVLLLHIPHASFDHLCDMLHDAFSAMGASKEQRSAQDE